ncbi:DNA-3-methyladenine glycosylase [Psychroflexus tropicus]|uniref:DNA-3-methyladenine glycosylase n=1 Tax=Psychroflexus tropicus TaxID=197345 RepID=UPI00037DC77E|nr:DNA-3-methyladenine glycosylase [Psychroflexus tropicus]
MSQILPKAFFEHEDVVSLAKQLIGKQLNTQIDGVFTSGIITETEAYAGQGDKACHAHLGKFTKRTKVMYEPGGVAYVYLCYGIHHLFNIVTNTEGHADAILIRAIEPTNGIQDMMKRRQKKKQDKTLTAGPGNMTQAMGITKKHNEQSIAGDEIWIEDRGLVIDSIVETTRVGIDYAEEDAELLWRFYDKNSKYISVK